jgi:hypothetical protein
MTPVLLPSSVLQEVAGLSVLKAIPETGNMTEHCGICSFQTTDRPYVFAPNEHQHSVPRFGTPYE